MEEADILNKLKDVIVNLDLDNIEKVIKEALYASTAILNLSSWRTPIPAT